MKTISSLVFCACLTANVFAQKIVKGDVAMWLLTGETQLQSLAEKMAKSELYRIDEAWKALEVLCRAERDEDAIRLMPRVYELFPQSDSLSGEYDPALVNFKERISRLPPERWNLSVAFFETFAAVVPPPFVESGKEWQLIAHLRGEKRDDDAVADWLLARYNSAAKSDVHKTQWDTAAQRWQSVYFEFLSASAQGADVFRRIRDDAKQSHNDAEKMYLFLASLEHIGGLEQRDADWVLEAFRASAYGSWFVAHNHTNGRLEKSDEEIKKWNEIREAFLKQALSVPLTVAECGKFREFLRNTNHFHGPEPDDEYIRVMFRVAVLDELNRLYLHTKKGDEAQAAMLEARGLRKEHGLPEMNLTAGMTQSASGWRVVENEIKEREQSEETNPVYWHKRARYYRGRNEIKEQEESLRRALALFDVATLSKMNPRRLYEWVLFDLLNLLVGQKREKEAFELFNAQHEAAGDNFEVLSPMYFYGTRTFTTEKLAPHIVATLRKAYDWLNANYPKNSPDARGRLLHFTSDDSENDRECKRITSSITEGLFDEYRELAIGAGVLDFNNDPFAWEILAMMDPYNGFAKYLEKIPSREGLANASYEKTIGNLKDLASREILGIDHIIKTSELLTQAKDYENANWFLAETLKNEKEKWHRGIVHAGLIRNFIALQDWRNCEKQISLCLEDGFVQMGETEFIGILRKIADLAEKSDGQDTAIRMREKIENLGAFP